MTDLRSLTYEKLCGEVKNMGLPAFRAKQIYEWLHQKRAASYDEMTNPPLCGKGSRRSIPWRTWLSSASWFPK